MKITITIFFSILFTVKLFSQLTTLPILNFDGKIQSKGIGDIGVVSSETNYQSAFNQNPALLGKAKHSYDAHVNYMPVSNIGNSFISSIGAMLTVQDNQALGLNVKYFSVEHAKEVFITGTYAYNFLADNPNKDLMIGSSFKFFQSQFTNLGISGTGFAFDIGMNYTSTIELKHNNYLKWQIGTALTNLGPKFSYIDNAIKDFIPTEISLGTMLSYQTRIKNRNTIIISSAYQLEKLGVPTPSIVDANNNGIPDFMEQPVIRGFFTSFNDAQRAPHFITEWQEVVHKIGLEGRLNVERMKGYLALRVGRFMRHENVGGPKYNTIGGTIGISGFYFDIALQKRRFSFGGLGFGVGFQTFL